ncbi:uncharacterized protein BO80DRAFT_425644 [Aspergillus ibericus CBS 121593]|uniref:Uncharacterized protein n=1 Tax=Aspergillus ibericus CBS 121593 TaxID=1448316 RepID=A0A395GY17_9EURO|nr:hypothetical protein BO80DRAFT_425644 [Aspergillus ibericus CBS 121593]RAL00481.1 hypothetical protein BO80DRAFT_425644 [Aspergillus ibericus CBS 121593]
MYMNVRQGAISCTFGDPPPITGRLDMDRPVTAGTVASAQEAGHSKHRPVQPNTALHSFPPPSNIKNFSPGLHHTGAGLALWFRPKNITYKLSYLAN